MSEKDPDSFPRKVDIYKTRSADIRGGGKLKEHERELIDLINKLDTQYENLIILVEGKRDEILLRDLGVQAPILKTQSGLTRIAFVNEVREKAGDRGQVLILTDFDKEGKELCQFIERELELSKVKILKRERRLIRKFMGPWRCIEDLTALFKRSDSPEASR